jgi:hypothetical protein
LRLFSQRQTPALSSQAVTPVQKFSSLLGSLVWLLVPILLFCQIVACIVGAGPSLAGNIDLRPFYSAGVIVRAGHASLLYDYEYQRVIQNAVVSYRSAALPFLYPPFAALLFVPLSWFSYRTAFFLLLVMNLALLVGAAVLLQRAAPGLRQRSPLLVAAIFGCMFGVSMALMQGQISLILLLIYCGSFLLDRAGRHVAAGMLLACGLMKFQIAIPVVVLYVLWRQWRLVLGFLSGAAILGGVSLLMVGRQGVVNYLRSLFAVAGEGALDPAAAKAHYGMFPTQMPNLHGLTYAISHGAHWGQILNVALCCVVIVYAARQKASMLVALPAAMLVSYHMQPHDLTLLLLPLSFILGQFLEPGREGWPHGPRWAWNAAMLCAVLLLTLPLAAIAMMQGTNYIVVVAVAITMMWSARGSQGTVRKSSAVTGAP